MTPEDYVSYPIALALKKHGFDWECDHYYCAFDNETDVRFWSVHPAQSQNGLCTPQNTVVADAPTLAQAQKWLREKGVAVSVQASEIQGELWYSADIISSEDLSELVDGGFDYMAYELALSAGIAAALELIDNENV